MPCTRQRSRRGIQREKTRAAFGHAPASPAPNRKRTPSSAGKLKTAPVNMVNADHQTTMRASTPRLPTRSAHHAVGDFEDGVSERERAEGVAHLDAVQFEVAHDGGRQDADRDAVQVGHSGHGDGERDHPVTNAALLHMTPIAHSGPLYNRKMPEFKKLIARLKRHYGEPQLPPARGPFELVMWENACYLLPDDRRRAVFEGLRTAVGLNADAIWKADRDTLLALAKMGGMRPETRVFRWREIARITLSQFDGNLDRILQEPYAKAKKALQQFPSIGVPGAEKILLFCGAHSGLPLEWNGNRVLTRVGYGRAQKNYGAQYRSVQEALIGQLPRDPAALARAHLLLREHGKTICRNNRPLCQECPAADLCAFALK